MSLNQCFFADEMKEGYDKFADRSAVGIGVDIGATVIVAFVPVVQRAAFSGAEVEAGTVGGEEGIEVFGYWQAIDRRQVWTCSKVAFYPAAFLPASAVVFEFAEPVIL